MYLKKMSVKNLGCDPKVVQDKIYAPNALVTVTQPDGSTVRQQAPTAGKKIPLCVIGGHATGTKTGENRMTGDPWTALTGIFYGVCIQEGDAFKEARAEAYDSGLVFLPGGIQELIEGTLEQAGEGGDVEFAIEILAGHDEKSATNYRYYGKNLKPPAASDKMANIRALMQPYTSLDLGPKPESAKQPEQLPAGQPGTTQQPGTTPAPGAQPEQKPEPAQQPAPKTEAATAPGGKKK